MRSDNIEQRKDSKEAMIPAFKLYRFKVRSATQSSAFWGGVSGNLM